MGEREPGKETIQRGELFFLTHPGSEDIFSGCGLAIKQGRKNLLVGMLMIDRPHPADPAWLKHVEEVFGEYQLVPITVAGERMLVCQIVIEDQSIGYIRRGYSEKANAIQSALEPLLDNLPNPSFILRWNDEQKLWQSRIAYPNELPPEILNLFRGFGYGCLTVETDIGVVHVCHASDRDVAGFQDKPVLSQWQLIKMPTAPLIRLTLTIQDQPRNPYRFESFLNVAEANQENVLAQLANQDRLHLAFYGDDLQYRYTKIIPHSIQQWQFLDEMVMKAKKYWDSLPEGERDYEQAKADFMKRFV
jgi:hypothetical protein